MLGWVTRFASLADMQRKLKVTERLADGDGAVATGERLIAFEPLFDFLLGRDDGGMLAIAKVLPISE